MSSPPPGTQGEERKLNINALARQVAEHPGEVATVRMSRIEATWDLRKHVRAALNLARIRDAEVDAYEAKGLFSSVFTVRMKGTGEQLLPALRALSALERNYG